MNNFTDKQMEIVKRVSNNIYNEAYGCWINIIYYRDYEDFDWLEQKELFLIVLKYLLDEGMVVLYPPSNLIKKIN